MQGNILTPTKIETEKDFLDFITPDLLPGARISTRGLSRLIGCQDTAIIDRAQVKSKKLAGMLEEKGIDPAHYRGGWTASAAWIALKYFCIQGTKRVPTSRSDRGHFWGNRHPNNAGEGGTASRPFHPCPVARRANIREGSSSIANRQNPDIDKVC